MNKQKVSVKTINETEEKRDLQLFYDTYTRYILLSKFLFGKDSPIYDINEMTPGDNFYPDAMTIARQLNITWDKMTHEESNRIMLAMLEDCYCAMAKVGDKQNLEIQITLKIVKNEQRQKRKTKRRTMSD